MTRTTLSARVGSDGILRLMVPVGKEQADQEVQITVEPLPPGKKVRTQAEYAAWVESMAGSWQGEFERPPQGSLREPEPF